MSYKDIRIEITGKCNLRCAHCHAAERNEPAKLREELTTDEILRLIKEARRLGIGEFELIGGEPFMHPDIFRIIDACEGTVNICTNGLFFTDKTLEELARRHERLRDFCISIDGIEAHTRMRSGSRADHVLEGIRRLKVAIPSARVLIQTTCTALNIPEIMELYEVLKQSDVLPHTWSLNMFWMAGRGIQNYPLLFIQNVEQLMRMYGNLIVQHREDGRPFVLNIYNVYNSLIADEENEGYEDYLRMTLETHPCEYHREKLCVRSDGSVEFCNSLHCVSANIRDTGSLQNAIAQPAFQSFHELRVRDLVECPNCRYLPLCGGGCRGEAVTHQGSLLEPDRMACRMMTLVEELILPILTKKELKKYRSLILPNGSFPRVQGFNTHP